MPAASQPLRSGTLSHHAARLEVPRYDRGALTPAVVHMSVGSFHRSHQAMYFDELARRGHTGWGLVGVGLHRWEMQEVLDAQDGLYTVVSRGPDGDAGRVVGVIGRYLFAPRDGAAVIDVLADPRTRVVTLTITGDGYKPDNGRGRESAHDDSGVAGGSRRCSAIAYLVEGLARRRRVGLPPFTVLSCDNVAGNGALARDTVLAACRVREPALAEWIADRGAFPSSMVDRITPRTSLEDRAWVERTFGVADRWPVLTEAFTQWVVEDSFCWGRPPLDEVGVQFVDDVGPYALMKTRLLNAGHCALGHLGTLAGYVTTHGAMRDPSLAGYVAALLDEVSPLLPPVPGVDLVLYRRSLLERFANRAIGDKLERLRRNGSSKVPAHVLSSVREARARGSRHPALTLAVAAWCRALAGTDERGRRLTLEDPLAERLQGLALRGGTDPRPLLGERELFGTLSEDQGFAAELETAMAALARNGARATCAALPWAGKRAIAA